MLLLLLGIALLFGATVQAVRTARAQQRTNVRVLESYARVAAWNFEEQLTPAVQQKIAEPLFHPLHLTSYQDGSTPPASIESLLADRPGECPSCSALLDAARFGVRLHVRSGAVETSRPLPPDLMEQVVAEVRTHRARSQSLARPGMHDGGQIALPLSVQDSEAVVLHYAKPVPNDTVVYAVVLRPSVFAPVFDQVLAAGALLPEPLTAGADMSELLAQSVYTRDGRRFYGSDAGAGYVGERRLSRLGGMVVRVKILEGAERHLIPAAAAALSWPVMFGLLAVALGLLVGVYSQMRREHALARLRSDFVSSVSHELRTPLSLQRIFLDTLRLDRATTAEQRAWCLDNIDRESMRLAHLVENVLLFSRSDRGAPPIAPLQDTRLAPLIAEILRAFTPLAAAAGARLQPHLDDDVVAPVDPGAIRQVMINILENAVKYGPRGQQIDVTLALDGDSARITVDDEGGGVPRNERQAIFQPYSRGRATVNSAVAGSGIGLAVVNRLVAAHGGRVHVEDAPRGGARFVILLNDARRASSWNEHVAAVAVGADAESTPREEAV